MRRPPSGFTLLELLILLCILALVVAVFGCQTAAFGSQSEAFVLADSANLRWHRERLEFYRLKNKVGLPTAGGHKFVLSTWSVADHTVDSFDRYFTPGRRDNDPHYRKKRELIERGEDPWSDLKATTSLDTHYAGRALEHLQSAMSGEDEALMADDNEGVWSHADGTVNVMSGWAVRTYSFLDLKELGFVQGDFDKDRPIETTGPNSPIPECRKLAR